jgi:hypothetical protein
MAVSLAAMRVLKAEFGIGVERAAFVAGHSLANTRRWRPPAPSPSPTPRASCAFAVRPCSGRFRWGGGPWPR